MLIYLIQPISAVKMSAILFFNWANHNPIKRRDGEMTGKKHGAFNMNLNLSKIKEASKKHSCTVNDMMSSILSTTVYEYFENHKEDNPAR